ncbi:hypothetical protein H2198_009060 [Neophaeococcomyces mojaviensis]|uniref:Uncharacterized protein n=1 Tax=Neophaeococcomyces mojaviensis TaxID=3383035 RepID=A0ACC2ZVV0_9EURO|nr:hypothetical protein H2198_009060 [Knufia sp. JES_112]
MSTTTSPPLSPLPFTTLDVFTTTPYHGGNPVAVIHIPASLSKDGTITPAQKQLIGREFNLSEIVFLHEDLPASTDHDGNPITPVPGTAKIDIFTHHREVPFAGHPTIGTSNYILRYLALSADPAVAARWRDVNTLLTRAGPLPISLAKAPGAQESLQHGSNVEGVQLNVAHNVHIHQPRLTSPAMLSKFDPAGRGNFTDAEVANFPVVSSVKGMTVFLVQLKNLDDLKNKPTMNIIGALSTYSTDAAELMDPGWQVGILTTYFYVDLGIAEDENGKTRILRTRMFGSREDPATGSAASALCGWLSLTEKGGGRVRKYHITQGVEMGRRCEIGVEVTLKEGEKEIDTLVLRGTAAKSMEGVLDVPILYDEVDEPVLVE